MVVKEQDTQNNSVANLCVFMNNPVAAAHTKDIHYGFICGIFIANKKTGAEYIQLYP